MSLNDTDMAAAIKAALDELVPPKPHEDPSSRLVLARSIAHGVVSHLQQAFGANAFSVQVPDGGGGDVTRYVSADVTLETW